MEEEVDGETSTINYDFNSSVTQLSTYTKEPESKRGKGPQVGLGQGQVHAWPLRPPQPSLQVSQLMRGRGGRPPLRLETRESECSPKSYQEEVLCSASGIVFDVSFPLRK